MKTKNFFQWLPAAAAVLLATACSSDNDLTTTAGDNGDDVQVTVIHYEAKVSDGNATRATLNDSKQYIFEEGDKLYVKGDAISGVLTLKEGDEGQRSDVTFEGDLKYTGSGTPDDDLELTAVLVGKSDAIHTIELDYITKTDYGTEMASTLAEAVQKYSHFTATSTYGQKSFTLSQQSAFLNFTMTLYNEVSSGDNVTFTINNGGNWVRSKTVTTTTVSSKVVAQFVAAFPGEETTMDGATVALSTGEIISFGGTTQLAKNKIYNIKKSVGIPATLAELKSSYLQNASLYYGWYVDASGNLYSDESVPSGVDIIGRVAYASETAGEVETATDAAGCNILVLAVEDVSDETYQWSTATSYTAPVNQTLMNGLTVCQNHNDDNYPAMKAALNWDKAKPSGSTSWFLPSCGQLQQMMSVARKDGTGKMVSLGLNTYYWTTTQYGNASPDNQKVWGWLVQTEQTKWNGCIKTNSFHVRACFAY